MKRKLTIFTVGMALLIVFVSSVGGATPTDSDGDGLSDKREEAIGTDPSKPDTDNDGLSDGKEIDLGTHPDAKDTDGDGIADKKEIEKETDPVKGDTGSPVNNQDGAQKNKADNDSNDQILRMSNWPLIAGVSAFALVIGALSIRLFKS